MDVTSSRRYKENPSFSSSLLDEIYRSIDERDIEQTSNVCKERKKPAVGRTSAADVDRNSIRNERGSFRFNSSSSSCDSISQNELMYGVGSKPKAIRTTSAYQHDEFDKREKERNMCKYDDVPQAKSKNEGKFVKTKSKALKIYSDLKKVKQPISPGGRLTRLLNSIFTNGNSKKMNGSSGCGARDSVSGCGARDSVSGTGTRSHLDRKSKSANASTCSSASSFSRSCLSNTPSSRGKLSSETKRSVRFYPVSVIVDEDCQPCGHKSLYEDETRLESVEFAHKSIHDKKKRDISEAARKLLKNYQKKVERKFDSIRNDEDEEQSDDDKSDSSSDLFELDNLSTIGMGKYREELPVYETTHLDTNRAIANGLFM